MHKPVASGPFDHAADIFRMVREWHHSDKSACLAVVTNTHGGGVRAPGALLAVSSENEAVGYVSGGCIDADIVLHCHAALEDGKARSLRYGAGSEFIDLPLPCGGTIDVLVLPNIDRKVAELAHRTLNSRNPVSIAFASEGVKLIEQTTAPSGEYFQATYTPKLKIRIAGRGADSLAIARLSCAAGLDVLFQSPDDSTLNQVTPLFAQTERLQTPGTIPINKDDPWTAFVLMFHDPDWESGLLADALAHPAFYIGAVGSRKTHERRRAALKMHGVPERDIDRVKGPIGLVPHMRDASFLAVSALAEIISCMNDQLVHA